MANTTWTASPGCRHATGGQPVRDHSYKAAQPATIASNAPLLASAIIASRHAFNIVIVTLDFDDRHQATCSTVTVAQLTSNRFRVALTIGRTPS